MPVLEKVVKEPLLYFLLSGAVLFFLLSGEQGEESDPASREIQLDRPVLLEHIQYRMKLFDLQLAQNYLDGLSVDELQQLKDEVVYEEALYREALALGLDSGDYLIKKRLIQKVEFLYDEFEESGSPDTQALTDYYEAYSADYRVAAQITFQHICR